MLTGAAGTARAAGCPAHATDDNLRPLPVALAPEAARLFGLTMPPALLARTTVVRCMDGALLACNDGADLPCGKANTARALPAALPWCRQNPNATFIPAYISGQDSIYNWRCANGAPVAGAPVAPVDPRGFLASYWKRLA